MALVPVPVPVPIMVTISYSRLIIQQDDGRPRGVSLGGLLQYAYDIFYSIHFLWFPSPMENDAYF